MPSKNTGNIFASLKLVWKKGLSNNFFLNKERSLNHSHFPVSIIQYTRDKKIKLMNIIFSGVLWCWKNVQIVCHMYLISDNGDVLKTILHICTAWHKI